MSKSLLNKFQKIIGTIGGLVIALYLSSCGNDPIDEPYIKRYEEWKLFRKTEIERDWLSLRGLFLMNAGENTLGSSSDNDHQFPYSFPSHFLTIDRKEDSVSFYLLSDSISVEGKGSNLEDVVLSSFDSSVNLHFSYNSYHFYPIIRGSTYWLRLYTDSIQSLDNWGGIERYKLNETFILNAKVEEYNPPKTINMDNVNGVLRPTLILGKVNFKYKDADFSLDLMEGTDTTYFVVFTDKTRGEETYGGGRYLYVNKPNEDGNTIIDFNYAYNPPCVFTEFATCPLPTPENTLPFEVKAGEKYKSKI